MLTTASRFLPALCILALCGCGDSGGYQQVMMAASVMEPTIAAGEMVRVDPTNTSPERWDVVVYQPEEDDGARFIFRVVALPGDHVSFDDEGLLINGKRLEQPDHIRDVEYVHVAVRDRQPGPEGLTVPAESYFVLGDNTEDAHDSRFTGPVAAEQIVGVVVDN